MLIQIGARSIVRLGHRRPLMRTGSNGRYLSAGLRFIVASGGQVASEDGRHDAPVGAACARACPMARRRGIFAIRPSDRRTKADDYGL
ncbi:MULTISPECIES: hypothetical protein [Burkholderia]|uniref:hypothetical protein n=1 Tax=Burkholderia TaxID=32008 RepID=UPI0009DF841A|nr:MULTISPECIES: hypothetical protein [Burkholderia]